MTRGRHTQGQDRFHRPIIVTIRARHADNTPLPVRAASLSSCPDQIPNCQVSSFRQVVCRHPPIRPWWRSDGDKLTNERPDRVAVSLKHVGRACLAECAFKGADAVGAVIACVSPQVAGPDPAADQDQAQAVMRRQRVGLERLSIICASPGSSGPLGACFRMRRRANTKVSGRYPATPIRRLRRSLLTENQAFCAASSVSAASAPAGRPLTPAGRMPRRSPADANSVASGQAGRARPGPARRQAPVGCRGLRCARDRPGGR